MIISVGHLLARCLLGGLTVLTRRELSKDAELLDLRHENAMLHPQINRVPQPGDRLWLAALPRPIPRRLWGEVFAVTPATLLAWHRRLVARKRDYTNRRRPRRAIHGGRDQQARDLRRHRQSGVGYQRVRGELVKLGHRIAASTVADPACPPGWIPLPGTGQRAENPPSAKGRTPGPEACASRVGLG
jgi:putative transposase